MIELGVLIIKKKNNLHTWWPHLMIKLKKFQNLVTFIHIHILKFFIVNYITNVLKFALTSY